MSAIAIALLALATAQSASGVKWRPLNAPPAAAGKPVVATPKAAPAAQIPAAGIPARPTSAPINAPVSAPSAGKSRIDLTCMGAGTANKISVATLNSRSHGSGLVGSTPFSGSGSGSATVMGSRQQGFNDQVDIRLFNGDDRIRMPRTMLPLLRGGKEGWFKLKNVVADARSIRASAAVNLLNNPKVFIDRVTGTISISGKAGDYTGQCQVIDSAAAPKF